MSSSPRVRPLFDTRFELSEGPCWHAPSRTLLWVDILGHTLHRARPFDVASKFETFEMKEPIGTVAPCKNSNSTVVVALKSGIFTFDLEGARRLACLGKPEEHLPNNRFNDGKCDPQGRFWAGTMSMLLSGATSQEPGAGSVYCIDSTLTKKIEKVTISNGLAWSSQCDKMFYIDTVEHAVRVYDFDASTGSISHRREAFKTLKNPDGMAIDSDNRLWVAHFGESCVIRYDPETGKQLLRIDLPCSQVTCPTFGGDDLRTLFITTARVGVSSEKEPLAGSIFVCDELSGVTGGKTFEFAFL